MSTNHLDDLRAQAQHARQRYQLYKAKVYGPRATSLARLRELERAYEQAEARLRAAEAQERRAHATRDDRPARSELTTPSGSRPLRVGGLGLDALAGRPHAVRERVHRRLGTRVAQTGTLAAAEAARERSTSGSSSTRSWIHSATDSTHIGPRRSGRTRTKTAGGNRIPSRFGFRTVANGPGVN